MLVITIVFVTACNNNSDATIETTKVYNEKEIPTKILDKLEQIDFEKGIYVFDNWFTDSYDTYIGSVERPIKIIEQTFRKTKIGNELFLKYKEIENENGFIKLGDINIYIFKLTTNAYSNIYRIYPEKYSKLNREERENYLFEEIKERFTEPITSVDINNQGKHEIIENASEKVSELKIEILQDRNQIPDDIWETIKSLDLKFGFITLNEDDRNCGEQYLLYCGGEKYRDNFRLSFSFAYIWESGIEATTTTGIIEPSFLIDTKDSHEYAKEFKYPFSVVRLVHPKGDSFLVGGSGSMHSYGFTLQGYTRKLSRFDRENSMGD